jgi:Mg2+-importing ATPase
MSTHPGALDPSAAYWSQPPDDLLQALRSGANGLSEPDVTSRLEQVGPNTLKTRRKTTAVGVFLNQFKSPIVLILLFATLISATLGDWVDALIVLGIVLGSAGLSFAQEYNANTATEKLRAQVQIKTTVVRDGQEQQVPAEVVVPGDVVLLSAGSLVPADGIVLEARDLFVNQAVLTGETFPVEKKAGPVIATAGLAERTNCVFMGTSVRSGSGRMLVVQTGIGTAFGQIAHRLTLRPPETEFERGVRRLGYLLSEVMFVLVIAVFATNVYFKKPVFDSLLFSIALAVGLTPQLLPAIINVNLSKGARAMADAGVIVRRLASIENFGSMDVLCTDKTGTLTEGVVRLDGALGVDGQPSGAVFRYAYLNAHLQTGLANPLDEAIVTCAAPDISGVSKLDEIPYDFVRKRLGVVVQEGDARQLIVKGALDNVLSVCTRVQDGTATIPMDDGHHEAIQQRFSDWSAQGLRVLGIAVKSVGQQPVYTRDDEHGLIFYGFLLFFDPPKSGVQEAIADLAELGVRLKIITGDNRLVARHTADAVGLQVTGILTGADLDNLHEEALWQAANRANLFAEVDPNQKERIILALKKMGHVVSYMGDGINDAPALHAADVGISVENAVDVAKDAADFVLMEQDLAVLHKGIVQGRTTFANTLKYVFMATSANFGNMFSMAGASLFLSFLPMLPKQILFINFLTDLPEMTIASDNVDPVFVQQPHRWNIAFIRRFMAVFGPLSSVFDYLTFAVLMWLFNANAETFRTGWFVESVLSATLVVFAVRTRLPFRHSRPSRAMLSMTALVALIVLVVPYTPLASVLGFKALSLPLLGAMTAIALAFFASAEAAKRWFYVHFST